MSQYPIEKGVPIPVQEPNRGPKYPWADMEVGDSFFVHGAKRASVASSAWKVGKTLECKFIVRPEAAGLRIWRVE